MDTSTGEVTKERIQRTGSVRLYSVEAGNVETPSWGPWEARGHGLKAKRKGQSMGLGVGFENYAYHVYNV